MHSRRILEIDLLRSVAIVLMIAYHAAFDLAYFYHELIPLHSLHWVSVQKSASILFLFLVGVSAVLSPFSWKRAFARCVRIGSAALMVSLATFLIAPESYVRFGILHLIAVSALLLPLVRRLREWNVLIAFGVWALAFVMRGADVPHSPWLLPLGIFPPNVAMLDYFPLVPWCGVIFVGYSVGYWWYARLAAYSSAWRLSSSETLSMLAWPGRHALLIYLLHQPILLVALRVLRGPF